MLGHGVTTIEAKSGYGLDLETEIRLIEVAHRLGAKARSTSSRPTSARMRCRPSSGRGPTATEAYVRSIIEEQLPGVAAHGRARFCDVFCEEGVFNADQSRRILEAAAAYGLAPAAPRRRARAVGWRGAGRRARAPRRPITSRRRPPAGIDALAAAAADGSAGRRDPAAGHDLVPDEGPPRAGPDVHRRGLPVAIGTDFNPGHLADRRACRWR